MKKNRELLFILYGCANCRNIKGDTLTFAIEHSVYEPKPRCPGCGQSEPVAEIGRFVLKESKVVWKE